MTPEQVQLVRSTWELAAGDPDILTTNFYAHLFAIDSGIARMFGGVDMPAQKKKLAQALAVVVTALDDLDSLLPALAALGKRHVNYGVTSRHFDIVGDALIWALRDSLGDAFTLEVQHAWGHAYAMVASVMRRPLERGEPRVPLQQVS
jgi:hemoglobin-like flavoprotein